MLAAGNEAFRRIPNKDSDLRWWKNNGLLHLNLLICCIFLAQSLNGYDGSLVGGFQSMPSWLSTMGNPSSSDIGLLNAATYLIGMVTAPFASYVVEKWGRKWCIRYAACTNFVGTAIGCAAGSGGSNGYAMFMVSRIIIGSGVAFALMTSPVMLQELPHPRHRTWIAGFFDVAFIFGNFIAAWVNFGTSHLTSNWSWRIPYLIHIPPALIMILVITWVPESPRWLMKNGREEEARQFFVKYHANGYEQDELVAFEFAEVKEALRMEKENKEDSWRKILTTRSSLHRLGCVVLIAVCQNLSGTAIISYYYTSILKLVGITDTTTQTGINAGLTSFTACVALFGLWLTQRIRRRPQLFITWTCVLIANIGLTACTAVYTNTGNRHAGIAAVAFVWIYNGAFFISCGSIFFSYPAEVLSYSMRGKGMMVWLITARCLSVFSSYTNPVAMTRLGWKWYLFYTAILVVTFVLLYFVIVETKGRTLEEIGELFDGKTLETSLHPEYATTMAYKKDGTVSVTPVDEKDSSVEA